MATDTINNISNLHPTGSFIIQSIIQGYVTSNGTMAVLFFPVDHDISKRTISNVEIKDIGQVRTGYGGYAPIDSTGVTVNIAKVFPNIVWVNFTQTSAFSGVTNNSTFLGIAEIHYTVS
jgi:hypothetical protein